jgi:hypothetical protein
MNTGPWTPEPPAPTRLYRCTDYPRRVRAESPSAAAAIVARYLARKRFGRQAGYRLREDGREQDRRTGRIVGWHYCGSITGPFSRRGNGYPILDDLRVAVRTDSETA